MTRQQSLVIQRVVILTLMMCSVQAAGMSAEEATLGSTAQPNPALSEGQQIMDFSLSGYNPDGSKRWDLQGEAAHIIGQVVKLSKVVALAYGKEVNVTLTGDEGTLDKSTNDMRIEKHVVATTTDGARLTTDYLDWRAKSQQVATDAPVFIEKQNMEIEGTRALAEPEFKRVAIQEAVTVRVKPATEITCTGPLEVDYERNIAVFHDDVVVNDARGQIFADRMDVWFNPENSSIQKVLATGNVVILRGQNRTYSDKAEYYAQENKVILSGSPRIEIFSKNEMGF